MLMSIHGDGLVPELVTVVDVCGLAGDDHPRLLSIAVKSEPALPEVNRFHHGWPTVLQHLSGVPVHVLGRVKQG